MKKLHTLAFSVLLLLLASQYVSGFSNYVSRIPNGTVNSCSTCHGPNFNPFLNSFGTSFDDNNRQWDSALAALDSDGDNFTNGQELADPDGGSTPIPDAQVTNPGEGDSVPTLGVVSVSIASPTEGFVFSGAPYLGPIVANSSNQAESITLIEFFSGQDFLGSVTEQPFSLDVNLAAGSHVLTAVATDYLGATGESQPVSVTVGGSPWYADASNIQPEGWRYFDWFKGFKPEGPNWIYHARHGWLYVIADDTSGMLLWDIALGRWMYTNASVYPWMYAYGAGGGWVFFFEGGSPGSRYFKRGDTGQIVSGQELSVSP